LEVCLTFLKINIIIREKSLFRKRPNDGSRNAYTGFVKYW
jgi:hypothetical protein